MVSSVEGLKALKLQCLLADSIFFNWKLLLTKQISSV
jgi:hypothetical protein